MTLDTSSPTFKDSGIGWAPQIPSTWDAAKICLVAKLESGHTPSRQHPEYWVKGECTIPWFSLADVWQIRDGRQEYLNDTAEKVSAKGLANSSARLLPAGTVVLSRTASVGFSGIMPRPMATTQDFANWICGPRLKPEYLLYCFRAMQAEFERFRMGSTHQTIYMPDIRRLSIPIPNIPEQDRIVVFLRRRLAAIDALIAKKERLIELLQEKQQALVAQAVTRGLDPTLPTKESAVEWLGRIPSHWSVAKLGFVADTIRTGPFGSQLHASDYIEDGVPVINPANLVSGRIVADRLKTVDAVTARRLAAHGLTEGDIVIGRRGEMGRCALVTPESDGFLCGTGCLRICLMPHLASSKFFARVLALGAVAETLSLHSVGSTMENLNARIVGSLKVPVPPITEQIQIAGEVDRIEARFGTVATRLVSSIDRLREYRQALISAAVTGKIAIPIEGEGAA